MPLAFQTNNRGTIAFGFFNIDTDLLLIDRFFLFASEFCGYIVELAEDPGESPFKALWNVDLIENPGHIGDLMGAIQNARHTGFIGEVYLRYPFPRRPEEFRQKPEGYKTREEIRGILDRYSHPARLSLTLEPGGLEIAIGPFQFSREVFFELLRYVWVGGYPRWRDMKRPDYVFTMERSLRRSRNPFFEGLILTAQ